MSTADIKLQKIIANLENTIKGKELLLAELQVQRACATSREAIDLDDVIKFLDINLEELRRILTDLR